MKILEIKNLSFGYNKDFVLENISLLIKKGDFVGLIGENGSGKSTLLNLILGLRKAKKGKIFFFNKPLSDFKNYHKIGYVPQSILINEKFPATVKEIVVSGLLSNKKFPKFYNSSDIEKVCEALKKVNLENFSNRRVGELSGGQKQRVLIAKALINNPELLILDEPTSGVDEKTQDEFYRILNNLHKEQITIILVSHDLKRITNLVNKIAILKNKKLEFYDHHEDFCKHPKKEENHHCLKLD